MGKEKLWLVGEGEVAERAGSPKTKSSGGGAGRGERPRKKKMI